MIRFQAGHDGLRIGYRVNGPQTGFHADDMGWFVDGSYWWDCDTRTHIGVWAWSPITRMLPTAEQSSAEQVLTAPHIPAAVPGVLMPIPDAPIPERVFFVEGRRAPDGFEEHPVVEPPVVMADLEDETRPQSQPQSQPADRTRYRLLVDQWVARIGRNRTAGFQETARREDWQSAISGWSATIEHVARAIHNRPYSDLLSDGDRGRLTEYGRIRFNTTLASSWSDSYSQTALRYNGSNYTEAEFEEVLYHTASSLVLLSITVGLDVRLYVSEIVMPDAALQPVATDEAAPEVFGRHLLADEDVPSVAHQLQLGPTIRDFLAAAPEPFIDNLTTPTGRTRRLSGPRLQMQGGPRLIRNPNTFWLDGREYRVGDEGYDVALAELRSRFALGLPAAPAPPPEPKPFRRFEEES